MRSVLILFLLSVCLCGQTVRVHHIDVGQGSAALVVGPTGTTCLIDAGPSGTGFGSVLPVLNAEGVGFLDYVVLTHYHQDHWQGLPELVSAGIGIGTAYDRGTTNQPGGLSSYLSAVGSARTTITPGVVIDMGGGASLTCVVVNGQVLGGGFVNPASGGQEENARSIGVRLDYGGFQEAICGDLTGGGNGTAAVEPAVASVMGDVDVMVLSHHGSNTSTSQPWADALDAEIGVISVGVNSPYGHPHWEPIQRFFSNPVAVELYRLNQGSSNTGGQTVNGTLLVETNGSTYTLSGGTIQTTTLNVDAGGPSPNPTSDLLPGDVVVSEYLNNPSAVSDSDGEWLELFNTTAAPIDLNGFTIRDHDFDSFLLPSLTIPARGRLVLAANGNSGQNGGVTVDYTWPPGAFFLANGADEIEVVDGGGQILDSVIYDGGPSFPDPTGDSVERIDLKALPYAFNFTTSSTSFGAGDNGTPGAANSADATGPWITLTPTASFTIGTTVALTIDGGPASGGDAYALSISECGAPGIEILPSGRVVDLCPTALFSFFLQSPNVPGLLQGFQGTLSPFGTAAATVDVPNVPAFMGLAFQISGVVLDASAPQGVWVVDNVRAVVN